MIPCYEENGICAMHGSHWPCTSKAVVRDILIERSYQYARYGDNRENEWGNGPNTAWLLPIDANPAALIEEAFREQYEEYEEETGAPTWVHLVREEVAEAFKCADPDDLDHELIQVAALCTSWVEKIRESRQWGVSTEQGTIVTDLEWHCPADVLRGSHYHGVNRVKVYYRYPGEEWREYK